MMQNTRLNPIALAVYSCLFLSLSPSAVAQCERDEASDLAAPIIYCNGDDSNGEQPNEANTTVFVNEGVTVSNQEFDAVFFSSIGELLNLGSIIAGEGAYSAGIVLANGGRVHNFESGAITSANGTGINLDNGGEVLNDGVIESRNDSIIVNNSDASVFNTGSLQSTDDAGVFATVYTNVNNDGGSIEGGRVGVQFTSNGDVTNQNSGIISGDTGVQLDGFATVNNSNSTITGNDTGVVLVDSTLNNVDGAEVRGDQFGVTAERGVVNNDNSLIEGGQDGVLLKAYELNNGNNGLIQGINGAGVVVVDEYAVVNNDAQIQGRIDGIYANTYTDINNNENGSIVGTNGAGINLQSNANVENSGAIQGSWAGVSIDDGGRIFNSETGSISATSGDAIVLHNGGEALNEGSIIAGDSNFAAGIVLANGGRVHNFESGAITSANGTGINLDNGGEVLNDGVIESRYVSVAVNNDANFVYNTGTLQSLEATAVSANGAVQVNNDSGLIVGAIDGVNMLGGGEVINQNGGSITADNGAGIVIQNEFTRVYNDGSISARWDGVYADTQTEINNSVNGSIAVLDGAGININAESGEVYNSGNIQGGWAGVHMHAQGIVVNNEAGEIRADQNFGRAISLNESGTVVNNGNIIAATGLQALGSDSLIINNANISGLTDDGVRMIGGGQINNSGNITGGILPESGSGSDGIAAFSSDTDSDNAFVANNTGSVIGFRNGMTLSQLDSVTVNDGLIRGNDGGILVQGSSASPTEKLFRATITNNGRIEALGNGPLEQSGFIEPADSAAVAVRHGMESVILNNNGEIISNATAIRNESSIVVNNAITGLIQADANNNGVGVAMSFITQDLATTDNIALGRHDDIINNAGVINGDILLGAGDDRFSQIGDRAQNNGIIDGGAGYDTFTASVAEGESISVNANTLVNIEVFEKLGAGFITYEGSAEFEEVFVRQGQLSLAENSIINLQTSLNNSNRGILTVSDGGILSGGGTVFGTVNVEDGGILNPGFSPGILTIDGDLNLREGGILQVQIEELADGTIAFDTYNVLGGFDITGGSVELLFSSARNSMDNVVSDLLDSLDFSDIFTFSTTELFNSFTDALTSSASFFTSADNGATASSLAFNSSDASFQNVTLTEGATLPSQTGPVAVNTPSTLWMLGIFSVGIAFLRGRQK